MVDDELVINILKGMSPRKETSRYLLIVDDSDDDVFILMRALRKNGVTYSVESAANGAQAIKYLEALLREDPEAADLPLMVLLDIKMPQVDGHEVLAWIRSQPALRQLPVYVLSSSELQTDIARARELGAVDYWTKPLAVSGFQNLALKIKDLLPPSLAGAV
ncbi:MAG TPA: response regulator [Candidatus Saccharimonadales bacterium]|nr:response regulator [Candidatus Saccharimonadales bacterium]